MRHLRVLVALVAGLTVAVPSTAIATFPGTDGLIVFSYESPSSTGGFTQTDLYTIAPDGSGLRRLTHTPNRNEYGAAWSADGTTIAFMRSRAPFGHGSIWLMAPDGADPVRLTEGMDARDPSWSPDGRRIAFTRFTRRGTDIFTIRARDGRGRQRVTSWRSLEFEPTWSPNGRRIAFTRGYEQGDVGDIWVVNTSTGHARRITRGWAYDHQATWSPDGSTITFARDRFTVSRIGVAAVDGSGATMLTSGHFETDPAFSPGGDRIVFVSERLGGFLPDLWLMDPDGTNRQVLRDRLYASIAPDWQPV